MAYPYFHDFINGLENWQQWQLILQYLTKRASLKSVHMHSQCGINRNKPAFNINDVLLNLILENVSSVKVSYIHTLSNLYEFHLAL